MNAKELLKYCRYYKGGDTTSLIGEYEKSWIDLSIKKSDILSNYIDEYIASGLRTFEQYDGTPLSLKSVLFNRYCHWNSASMIECASGFKDWYNTEYKKS